MMSPLIWSNTKDCGGSCSSFFLRHTRRTYPAVIKITIIGHKETRDKIKNCYRPNIPKDRYLCTNGFAD